jgi:hypothetical protein
VREMTFATRMLMTATFCMTAVASVGVYQSLFVMPEYFSSPPAKGCRWLRQSTIRLVLMLAAAVLLVIALGT